MKTFLYILSIWMVNGPLSTYDVAQKVHCIFI